MTNIVASPFSNTFQKNVTSTSSTQQNADVQSNVNEESTFTRNNNNVTPSSLLARNIDVINRDLTIQQENITEEDFTLATSIEVSNQENKNVNSNISSIILDDGEDVIGFSDEWSRKTEKSNSKEVIDNISIKDLYYQSSNVLYDAKTKEVFFRDASLAAKDQNECVLPKSDIISLAKLTGDVALIQLVDKINTFGKVYDFQFKSANFGEYKKANVSICSSVANALGYLSFDKLLNDEIIRKKKVDKAHEECPERNPAYSGFLTSKDYIEDGWINIDQLATNDQGIVDEEITLSIRTKKIKEAKRILIKLLLNVSSSIPELNSENKLVDFGFRIKNTITGQIFDEQNVKNGNIGCIGNQVILSYGGKLIYGDPSTNESVGLKCDPCDKIIQDKCTGEIVKVANCVVGESIEGTSHEIMPQIRLNSLIGIKEINPDFVNTIDPIQWTTGIQNVPNYKEVYKDLIKEWGEAEYIVGNLNVPRSFHYASGDANRAYVCGGFFNSVIKENISTNVPNAFLNTRGWSIIGDNSVYYEIATPGGYDYNVTNSFIINYEEEWDGSIWTIKNNTVIPTPKAMGLAGGGKNNEEKIIGFGAYTAEFLNNGVVKNLYPTSQVWVTQSNVWTHLNNANYARVSPSGYLKTSTVSSSGANMASGLVCNAPPIDPKQFFYADSNPDSFPNTEIRIDPATQLKLVAAMKSLVGDTSKTINTNAVSNIGIVFNGWIGGGGSSAINGLGSPGNSNINPFGLDRIKDSEITNIFEYMQELKVDFSSVAPSLTPSNPSVASSVTSTFGWYVDTTRNYPIKTMGTLYLGNECFGVATGGKTGASIGEQSSPNTIENIRYSYFKDSRYNEFNNSIVNLVYEFNGTGWIRRDNMLEAVAFHTGVGDGNHQVIYGGLHGSVEKSDISVSYPGCDEWESMITKFGGTWHRFGTTGLDREKRYASFSTIHLDAYKNLYYKVGDNRDILKNGIKYAPNYILSGRLADLSAANWSSYVNGISGHMTQIAYSNKNSRYKDLLDITYFFGGESWVGPAIKYEKLNNDNSILPYAERESALDDIDQVGFITKNVLSTQSIKYEESYKPDYNSNPLNSIDGITSFPTSGYFATKDNYKNIINKYKYAGHPTDGGMWLWSRPTAGEELFHPTNIHDKPKYYFDSCGIKSISGTWQNYESWIDSSFKTNIGLHSAICWYENIDCLTKQDSDEEKANGFATEVNTSRNYRWTMGDFRIKANRLSPGGKEIGCLDINVVSDRELLYKLGYISICDFISDRNGEFRKLHLADGITSSYKYAWDVKNGFRRVILCPSFNNNTGYVGYIENDQSIDQIQINGVITDIDNALTIAPSANWATFFDYVYENIESTSSPLSGVFFRNDPPKNSGVGYPIQISYSSNIFDTSGAYSEYPIITVNPTGDFVGYNSKCLSPIDYFNRIWFIPSTPISACCKNDCDCLVDGVSGDSKVFYHTGWFDDRLDVLYGCKKPDGFQFLIENDSCENNSCMTWWTSGCHVSGYPTTNIGFYWVHGANAPYLLKDYGFYPNSFNISGCEITNCQYGIKDPTRYWHFELPNTTSLTKLDNLRELYDTLSFGLPQEYVKPAKFTYSFYITRDGVGLDQLFYGKKRNTFVERWKFPHREVINEVLLYNNSHPYIVSNDGSGMFTLLEESDVFKYGTISVGEFNYPKIQTVSSNTLEDSGVDASELFNSIVLMSKVQSDISSSRVVNYYTPTSDSITASCNFDSLYTWLNTKVDTTLKEKFISNYYPMTYDNFNGPITGGKYFLPRGVLHQSQFSIIPSANSSSIRDRTSLWPWCDLLEGKSTNKPKVGAATWNWDIYGNIWTAEVLDIERVTPKFCYDQDYNNDILHRKHSTSTINAWYPKSYDREVYKITCHDKQGNLLVDYNITYDEAAGPEIVGSKEGFDYNIFGTALKPRSIDLERYNNKPLNGPSQFWVNDTDEINSVHAVDWKRTELKGTSGCPIDLYPYNYTTLCSMLSGGYYKHNIRNSDGYFCRIESDKDTWIYSAPIGDVALSVSNENFFIQESPFAIKTISQGSSAGMASHTFDLTSSGICVIDGFPPLTRICYSVSSAPSACCYIPGLSGNCLSFDPASAIYAYDSNVCKLYVKKKFDASTYDVSGNLLSIVPCISTGFIDISSIPLSSIGFFSYGQVSPSGYEAPYEVLGWVNCDEMYGSYGSEIVRAIKYENGVNNGGVISSAYITGPQSHGLGGLGLGKSSAMCGTLLYTGERVPCQYSQTLLSFNNYIPSDAIIRKSWPWNVLGFDGLLGPTGYTDALDDQGNYWIAIGDFNNTNPYNDSNFISFQNNRFKNYYTIIKINANKKYEFFKTVLARTNLKEVDGDNLLSTLCLSNSFDLVAEDIKGTRLREGIMESINMLEGHKYFDIYVKLIQENDPNIYNSVSNADKANYETPTYVSPSSIEQISGAFVLPIEPLVNIPVVKPIQRLELVSSFDINCISCFTCDDTFLTDCPSASNWKQHNHEEWIAPYLESPFAGPYSDQGFNIWLTAGSDPRWGVSLWSSIRDNKVWTNYRRQRLHVNQYRNHLVLATMTASVAIDDFEALSTSSYNLSGSIGKVPVYVNYDEFIYCLDDYRNARIVKDIISKQTINTSNGVDCSDNIIASVNNNYLSNVSGNYGLVESISGSICQIQTTPCSAFNLDQLRSSNEGYVEWATSFIQEYRGLESSKCAPDKKYYFKYNTDAKMDSNTYIERECITSNDIISYQWRRYQDGVGLGGDAPAINLYGANNEEFVCNRINQWFIGQTAIGDTSKSIIAGGYAIAGDGELHRSRSWWESPTFGITFKWNVDVIQPEDNSNINYKYRTLSPFWGNGNNSAAKSTMGVTIFDVGSSTKVERQGFAKFENNIIEYNVLFTDPIPDYLPNNDKYCISLVSSDNVKVWWEDKTSNGFKIKAEAPFVGFVDWSIYLEDTIPGKNVDSLDEQETFEKFEDL
jgi:hypothetical protein